MGGNILAGSIARDELERHPAEDPFNAVAEDGITALQPIMAAYACVGLKTI